MHHSKRLRPSTGVLLTLDTHHEENQNAAEPGCSSVLTLTVWLEGMCKVLGPCLPMNRFWSLVLANVPLVITASFPLRAPYELNSRGVRLRGNS